ncbi:glycosyltransferase [Maribacter sp. R77961]|uniref:glycosyltransferase n=1 Tax=Maribacter sp. R77961 TaxID=3093871 RepID=UPI0037CC58F9
MTKLLQINTVVTYGSTGRIVDGIGDLAIAENWGSYAAYGRKEANSKSELFRVGNLLDNYLHVLDTRLFGRHGLATRSGTKDLIKWIKEINPSIIQLHNLHGYYLNLPILFDYLSSLEIPIVMSLHDSWNLTGHCPQFEHVGCEKWKTNCNKCPQLREYPSSLFIDRSSKNHKLKKRIFTSLHNLTLITSSEWSANLIRQSYLSEYPINIIPNGVDTSIFYPREAKELEHKFNLDSKFIILGVASVWDKNKGFFDFIELSKKLKEDEVLVMIGLDTKQLQGLPSNIIGIERTQNIDELAQWYSLADAFINLTYADTFPTTNLEALACGTPVLTYRTGGSTESVDERTGFVVNQGDIDDTLKKLRTIKAKGKETYSEYCSDKALLKYQKDKQFYEYIKIYKEQLNLKDQ